MFVRPLLCNILAVLCRETSSIYVTFSFMSYMNIHVRVIIYILSLWDIKAGLLSTKQ